MEAATLDRIARGLAGGTARRGMLRGLGGFAVATVLGTAVPRGAAADEKRCKRKEKRCKRRCQRKDQGGLFGCGLHCEKWCGL